MRSGIVLVGLFKADFDAGKTKFLFRMATSKGDSDAFKANFVCGGFSLTVTQLVP